MCSRLWYLAKVLEARPGGGALVEYVEYGDVAECGASQLVTRVAAEEQLQQQDLEQQQQQQQQQQQDKGKEEAGAETPQPQRRRGDSSWLVRIDTNLGSRFGAEPERPKARRASTVVDLGRTLDALERMSLGRPGAAAAAVSPEERREMDSFLREELEELALPQVAFELGEEEMAVAAPAVASAAVASPVNVAAAARRRPDESEEGISDSD